MSQKIVMSIKTDKEIKEKAQAIAKQMGFSLGTLLSAYLHNFVIHKTVYFSAEPVFNMSKKTEKELDSIEKDIKTKKNLSKKYKDVNQALSYLKS